MGASTALWLVLRHVISFSLRGTHLKSFSANRKGAVMDKVMKDFPFTSQLSLQPLIRYLRQMAQSPSQDIPVPAVNLEEILAAAPELDQPITDWEILKTRSIEFKRLMSALLPAVYWETEAFAAIAPFSLKPFIVSPAFQSLFLTPEGGIKARRNIEQAKFEQGRAVQAYLFILEKFYNIQQSMNLPIIYITNDPETGLERHYQFHLDFRFVEVSARETPQEPTPEERRFILDNISQPLALRELIPPENFILSGFTMVQAVEVTQSQVVSALERELIDQESIVTSAGFLRLQERLRTLFGKPDLMAGISALRHDRLLLMNAGCCAARNCFFGDIMDLPLADFKGTIFEEARKSEAIISIPDLATETRPMPRKEEIMSEGVRSMLIAPLHYQGRMLGTFALKSPKSYDFMASDRFQLAQLQPLFSMAIKNALDDLDYQIQAIIKEKCTAIHPSVEWRFRRVAHDYLMQQQAGRQTQIEPIVFKNVYPVYGATDVRGSTDERNRAIQEDLRAHLHLAREVVAQAQQISSLPILSELLARIHNLDERIAAGLGSSDEYQVVSFLSREVESIFDDMESLGPEVARAVENYRSGVDPNLGTVYNSRRRFEASVSRLNDRLAAYLDWEEANLQTSFPHYFERHRTDGVDYTIYLGASLMEDGRFNRLYLKNFRLWQIMVACGMAWHNERLKAELEFPLDTAHLILLQDTPLSIRFRYDEKRFDVDGAYDIRHEIVRSRLDKAVVKGNGDRLTQPGQVAIVYSQPTELLESRRHLEYLRSEGFLSGEEEKVELEEMPGVQGLRALRVGIDLESETLARRAKAMND